MWIAVHITVSLLIERHFRDVSLLVHVDHFLLVYKKGNIKVCLLVIQANRKIVAIGLTHSARK